MVLTTVPHLLPVAAALKLARWMRMRYPIEEHDAFGEMFRRFGGRVILAGHQISWPALTRFLPKAFFPIRSEEDLMYKLLIAFQRGDLHHAYERWQRRTQAPPRSSASVIPAPTMNEGDPVPFDQ